MEEGVKAEFSFDGFRVNKLVFDFDLHDKKNDIKVKFDVSGTFSKKDKKFQIYLDFIAYDEDKDVDTFFVNIKMKSIFSFKGIETIDKIHPYFYRNSLAISFPYLRSFLSSVSLQANNLAVILPTMNLSNLENPLKENITTVD